jgi:hypothetical protein
MISPSKEQELILGKYPYPKGTSPDRRRDYIEADFRNAHSTLKIKTPFEVAMMITSHCKNILVLAKVEWHKRQGMK